MSWSIANAKTVSNSFGEIKLDKDLQQKRIDPVDAIIDAWKMAMTQETEVNINKLTEEYLNLMNW